MLRHRLWLALIGYVIVATALLVALRLVGASTGVTITAGALLSLLVGFEAATLRRFTLSRRGWRNAGIVVADDLESAERRFFDAWVHKTWVDQSLVDGAPRASSPAMGVAMARRPSSEVIGLFSQPGASRGPSPSSITARAICIRRRRRSSAPRARKGWRSRLWGRANPRRAPPPAPGCGRAAGRSPIARAGPVPSAAWGGRPTAAGRPAGARRPR